MRYIVRAIMKTFFVYISSAPDPPYQFKVTMTVLPRLPLYLGGLLHFRFDFYLPEWCQKLKRKSSYLSLRTLEAQI